MGQAVTKNYKRVKLRQECYQSTIVPLWLHNRYNVTYWTKMHPEINNR